MILCNSSVLVDIDRGNGMDRIERLDSERPLGISVVTETELRLGVEKQYERGTAEFEGAMSQLDALLSRFEVLPVGRSVSQRAARILASLEADGNPLHDLHDVYIGATAAVDDMPVLTANVSHFERIDGVRVRDWQQY
ncbi:MAG: type II toxin-antitoxin system VapC family toxin [Halodesulfurarchaeum sp.]|nr:type II toxin-antitoxin system VapC family toxin [Halodesulfurarchaeum sp.]